MMDAPITRAVEAYVHAGFPTDAAAILIVEVDGLPAAVEDGGRARVGEIGRAHGARTVRVAADDAERALIWKGRKTAFGAIARIKPNYYLHDTVVPRARLVEVLSQGVRDRRPPRADRHERVPRRRRQPAPAAGVRQARAGRDGAGARRRRGDRAGERRRRRRAVGRARHRPREAGPHAAACSVRSTSTSRPGCGRPSTPTAWPTRTRSCPPAAGAATSSRSRRARGSDALRGRGGGPADPVTCSGSRQLWEVGGAVVPGRGRSRPRRVSSGSRPRR